MKKSKAFLTSFERRIGLENRTERIWFWCGFALLTVYVETVVFLQDRALKTPHLLAAVIALFLVYLSSGIRGNAALEFALAFGLLARCV